MMTVLAIIYLICLPFTVFFVGETRKAIPESQVVPSLMLFISVWLILPLFPVYLAYIYLRNKIL